MPHFTLNFALFLLLAMLANTLFSAEIVMKKIAHHEFGFGLNANQSYSEDFEFFVDEIPLCGYQLRKHTIQGFTKPVFMGEVPRLDGSESDRHLLWPSLPGTLKFIANYLQAEKNLNEKFNVVGKKKCLTVVEGKLTPIWQLELELAGFPYRAHAHDSQVIKWEKKFFDMDGVAEVYEKNPKHGVLARYPLKNLSSSGYLESDRFQSVSPNKAHADDFEFVYDPDDFEFLEVSVFTHANLQADFFATLGFDWQKSQRISLYPRADFKNSAYYYEASGIYPPFIAIGEGDSVELENLATDSDVISHEVGHHIVFQYLKGKDGESLVLHEGLADFFAFARSNDACLGESLCPKGSSYCSIAGECLRTAENQYVLDVNTDSEEHIKSQFLSGMLWDLRSQVALPEILDTIVYKAVTLLHRSSGYHDWILTMMLADAALFEGKYCGLIQDAAIARGLASHIEDLECNRLDNVEFSKEPEIKLQEEPSSFSPVRRKELMFCGISNASAGAKQNLWLVLFLTSVLILPFATTYFRQSASRKRRPV